MNKLRQILGRVLRTGAIYALIFIPVAAVAIYLLELRVQARFIPRVAVNVQPPSFSLSGLDQAVAENAAYLWRSSSLREQISAEDGDSTIQGFYIDKYEVSQRNYRKFLGWLALQSDKRFAFANDLEPLDYTYINPYANHKILGRLDMPIAGASFYEAYAYCQAAGGSLPSIEQWMAAAAGTEGRSYPWGEKFIGTPWRYNDPILNLAAPEKNRIKNATPQGVFDMGNGLSEWTINMTEDGRSIQKGGNNYNRPFMLQSLNFIERPAPLDFRSKYSGFRCVYMSNKFNNAKNPKNPKNPANLKLPWEGATEAISISGGTYPLGISKNSYAPKLMEYIENSNPRVLQSFLAVSSREGRPALSFSKYEISRREYRHFLRDPLTRLGFYANGKEPRFHSYVPASWREQRKQLDLPVVGVDWWSAYAFTKWAGGRLPTEEEWLQVFSDGKITPYIWGDKYVSGFSHTRDASAKFFPDSPIEVTAQTNDTTSNGLVAMAGNISEWTSSVEPYNNGVNIIVKGGNYKLPGRIAAHYSYNARVPPNHKSDAIGIRVVFD